MVLLPILAREARRAAKRPAIYRFRLGAVFFAVFTGIYLLIQARLWTASAAVGRDIFQILVWIAFAFCLLSGVMFASGLLCQERRDGSLALLFLTRLTGLDVILGKLTAILLITGQVALGLFPVLALCIPLGGVSFAEFWRAAAVLLATLSLSLSTALFVSALNRELSRSVLISFAIIIIPTVALGFLDSTIRGSFPGTPVGVVLPGLVPLMTSFLDEPYSATPRAFELCLAYQFVFAALLLALGGHMLKRLSIENAPIRNRFARIFGSRAAMPAEERRELLRRNPIYWLSQRHRWRWLTTWTIFSVLLVIWFYALEHFQFLFGARLFIIFAIAPVLHLLLKIAMAAESSSRLANARDGELELLLATPLTSGQIIRGQQRGLIRQFLWPVITILAVDLFFSFAYGTTTSERGATSIFGYLFIYTLGISIILDAPAIATVGLWQGLQCANNWQALQRTILQVVFLPLTIYAFTAIVLLGPLLSVMQSSFQRVHAASFDFWIVAAILYWWIVRFVCNAFAERTARFHLKTFLRFIAADPQAARAILLRDARRGPRSPLPHRQPALRPVL
ncbi:MAG TPA: hypothetical protein VM680_13115 [Verrucomicrobiae bacterium]|nr:hypothetical protein [Verrucomicrobiae bacterium]